MELKTLKANSTIDLVNKDKDTLFFDQQNASAKANQLASDYKALIGTFEKISKAYKTLYTHKDSKGVLKTNLSTLVKASNNRVKYTTSVKSTMQSSLQKCMQDYSMALLDAKIAALEQQLAAFLASNSGTSAS